jgi:hypothetical protein
MKTKDDKNQIDTGEKAIKREVKKQKGPEKKLDKKTIKEKESKIKV